MSHHFQSLIRSNANEEASLRSELNKWTQSIKKQDSEYKKSAEVAQKDLYPPIRGTEDYEENQDRAPNRNPSSGGGIKNEKQIFPGDETVEDFSLQEPALEQKELGNTSFRKKKYAEADGYYTKSLNLKKDPIVFCNRAAARFQLKKYDEAEQDCTSSLLLNGQYAKAYIRRAMIRKAQHRYVEAIQDFERAMIIEPENRVVQKQLDETRAMSLKAEAQTTTRKKKLIVEESTEEDEEEEAPVRQQEEVEQIRTGPKIEEVEAPQQQDGETPAQGAQQVEEDEVEELVTTGAQRLHALHGSPKRAAPAQKKAKTTSERKTSSPAANQREKSAPTTKSSPPPHTAKQPSPEKVKQEQKSPAAETTEPQSNSTTKKPPAHDITIEPLPTIKAKIPTKAPAGIYEFHQVNKELNNEEFAQYFQLIEPKSMKRLFGDDLSPDILERILTIIADHYLTAKSETLYKHSLSIMEQLTKVNRFDMTIMFFEEREQAILERIFERLMEGAENFGGEDRARKIREIYEDLM